MDGSVALGNNFPNFCVRADKRTPMLKKFFKVAAGKQTGLA